MFLDLSKNKFLIKELTKRDIESRYKGSLFGILWTIITPLAMLIMFSFVFSEIFQAKWPGNENMSKLEFSINLFIGLGIFWFFSEILTKSPTIFSSVPNYIKKVVFPLEILPIVSLFSACFHFIIYILIIFIASVFFLNKISITFLALPLIIFCTFPLLIGSMFFLGSIGIYVKDISSIIGVIISMLMFLSPIFYPVNVIPDSFQWLFYLNPLTLIIESCREIILLGIWPNWINLFIYLLISTLIYFLGFKLFKFTKKGFADVI